MTHATAGGVTLTLSEVPHVGSSLVYLTQQPALTQTVHTHSYLLTVRAPSRIHNPIRFTVGYNESFRIIRVGSRDIRELLVRGAPSVRTICAQTPCATPTAAWLPQTKQVGFCTDGNVERSRGVLHFFVLNILNYRKRLWFVTTWYVVCDSSQRLLPYRCICSPQRCSTGTYSSRNKYHRLPAAGLSTRFLNHHPCYIANLPERIEPHSPWYQVPYEGGGAVATRNNTSGLIMPGFGDFASA